MKRWVIGMRDSFSQSLYAIARRDRDVMLVSSDTGAICHDEFRKNLPGQYLNVGIAEQNMVGVAAGLAMSGKKVFVYAIVPFATMRCYEQIRIDLCCMDLPVTVVGVGAGFDYSTLGPTHHGTEDIALMRALPGMTVFSPADSLMADRIARACHTLPGPKYVRLDRTGYPLVYPEGARIDVGKGFGVLSRGEDLMIVATGRMVYAAQQVAAALAKKSVRAGVIDLFRIKPLEADGLLRAVSGAPRLISLEEHFVCGGVGSALAELLVTREKAPRFRAFGIPHAFCRRYGKRDYLLKLNGLDVETLTREVGAWVRGKKS